MQKFLLMRVALVAGLFTGASMAHAVVIDDFEYGPDYVSTSNSHSYVHDVGSLAGYDVISATLRIWLSEDGNDGAEYARFRINGGGLVINTDEVDGSTCPSTIYCASWDVFGPYNVLASLPLTGILNVEVQSTQGDFWFKRSQLTVEYRTREVPEPAALSLLGVGLLGMGVLRRRQRRG